ncbi:MAG: PEP-CTERM sorting domain-containing protein [Puniceicoccaceae bacterium]
MKSLSLSTLLLFLVTLAHGQITLNFQEVGPDVVVTANGSWQVSAIDSPFNTNTRLFKSGSWQAVWSLGGSYGRASLGYSNYDGGPLPLASAANITQSARTGDYFGFEIYDALNAASLYGNPGFVATDSVNGTATFAGLNFTSAGLIDGTSGAFSVGAQDFNWFVGSAFSAVPEPSTYAAIAFGVLGLAVVVRRRLNSK